MSQLERAGYQSELQRCEILELALTVPAPTQPTASSPPHYVMSPRTPAERQTTGINFFIEPRAGEATGPFAVTLWKRDPTNRRWANWITIPALPADTWMTVCRLDPSELYFQVTPTAVDGSGRYFVHVEEIGG